MQRNGWIQQMTDNNRQKDIGSNRNNGLDKKSFAMFNVCGLQLVLLSLLSCHTIRYELISKMLSSCNGNFISPRITEYSCMETMCSVVCA